MPPDEPGSYGRNELSGIKLHLWEFALQRDEIIEAAMHLKELLEEILEAAGVPYYTVESRAKSIDSYRAKSERVDESGAPRYADPRNQINDCIAARVIVFSEHARQAASDQVRFAFTCSEDMNPGEKKRNGYDSQHFIVDTIRDGDQKSRYKHLTWYLATRPGAEIQIRTVAGHAWAEYEHDIRYKPSGYRDLTPGQRRHVDQLFTEAGGLRRYMDETFNQIEIVLASQSGPDAELAPEVLSELEYDGAAMTETTLSDFLTSRYPGEPINGSELRKTLDHLRALGVESIEALERILDQGDPQHVKSLMDYRTDPGAVRYLDDELLAILGSRYVATVPDGQDERLRQLEARFRRVGGKTLIYSLIGVAALEGKFYSAAGMVRELVRQVADRVGLESAEIDGASSASDALDVSTRSKPIDTSEGKIWVNTNMTRIGAETYMRQLLDRLEDSNVAVLKAGDEIARSSSDDS